MTHPRTLVLSSYEALTAFGPLDDDDSAERMRRLCQFPHAAMLQMAIPEMDFASRLCWQKFGPADGECDQLHSEYRVCDDDRPHSHIGSWTKTFFVKTDYNFGFCEWYFAAKSPFDQFCESLNDISWGEHYPK